MKTRFWKNNDSHRRFVDIGLENVAVAAARVVELPPRCNNKRIKNVDVYKTFARIIFVRDRGAAQV